MRRVEAMAIRLSKDEIKILLHAYMRDNTYEQMMDRYTEDSAKEFFALKEKLIVMLEVSES